MFSYKNLRYVLEQDRHYSSPVKAKLRDYLIKKYILPKVKKGKEVSVLDFFGTGRFVEAVTDQLRDVKNQQADVNFYEIEQDKKLHNYMREFVNQLDSVSNQRLSVNILPFYGSLQDFVQSDNVENQTTFDLIFADYCGMVTEDEIMVLEPITGVHTAIVLTVDLNCMSTHRKQTIQRVDNMMENVFRKEFPLFKIKRIRSYKRMVIYEARVPYFIRKEVDENVWTNRTSTRTAVTIPSSASFGISG